jgi:hypothetical protein
MGDRPLHRLFWRVVDYLDYLVTLARLRILDALAGPLPETPADGFVTVTDDVRTVSRGLARRHAAATASCHCAVASARRFRRVARETRWR